MKTRDVNKRVRDFPEKTDLSTPESALAARSRQELRMDIAGANELTWEKFDIDAETAKQFLKTNPAIPKDFSQGVLDKEIIKVLTFHDDFAVVICKSSLPLPGGGRIKMTLTAGSTACGRASCGRTSREVHSGLFRKPSRALSKRKTTSGGTLWKYAARCKADTRPSSS